MKFTSKEIEFLQKHKNNFEKGNFEEILADYKEFGSYQKLVAIFNELLESPANVNMLAKLSGADIKVVDPKNSTSEVTSPQILWWKLPSISELEDPNFLQPYSKYLMNDYWYWTDTTVDGEPAMYTVKGSPLETDPLDLDWISGFRPVVAIGGVKGRYPALKRGDTISINAAGKYIDFRVVYVSPDHNTWTLFYEGELISRKYSSNMHIQSFEESDIKKFGDKWVKDTFKDWLSNL